MYVLLRIASIRSKPFHNRAELSGCRFANRPNRFLSIFYQTVKNRQKSTKILTAAELKTEMFLSPEETTCSVFSSKTEQFCLVRVGGVK